MQSLHDLSIFAVLEIDLTLEGVLKVAIDRILPPVNRIHGLVEQSPLKTDWRLAAIEVQPVSTGFALLDREFYSRADSNAARQH